MTNPPPPNDYDQPGIMRSLGPVLPALVREAVDSGQYSFNRSRSLNPDAFVRYTTCTLANMLIDEITSVGRELIDLAAEHDPRVWWKISTNKRATEIYCNPWLALRIKRSKQNRGGRTTSVDTDRQLGIKSRLPMFQMSFPFYGQSIVLDDEQRLWLTVTFDLDELEETLTQVLIGVELRDGFLWQETLPEADEGVLASLPQPIADRISELQVLRSA